MELPAGSAAARWGAASVRQSHHRVEGVQGVSFKPVVDEAQWPAWLGCDGESRLDQRRTRWSGLRIHFLLGAPRAGDRYELELHRFTQAKGPSTSRERSGRRNVGPARRFNLQTAGR